MKVLREILEKSFEREFLKKKCEKMAKSYILVHHNGEITNTDEGVTFCSQNPQFMTVHPPITLLELQNTILQKLGQQNNKQIM